MRKGLLVCALALVVVPVATLGQKSLKTLKRGLEDVQRSKRSAQKKLKQTKANIVDVKAQMSQLEDRMQKASDNLEDTKSRLEREREQQATLTKELAAAQAKVKEKRVEVERRVRSLYMEGKPNVLEFVFGSQSSADLATREFIATRVKKADHKLFEDFRDDRDDAQKKKKEQDQVVRQVASLQQEQVQRQHELESTQKAKESYLNGLESKKVDLQEALDQLDSDSEAIQSEIRAAMARAKAEEARRRAEAKKQGKPYVPPPKSKGGLVRPTGGPITSGFGQRYHPILHYTRLHAGIDFGGGYGAAVYSAGTGTVIAAGTRGGYGNCIVIDHGNGMSTLYGHLSRIMVSAGQTVGSHQRIGSIGSSGLATGPHLHFEVRINGSPVNPLRYL